jgi:hypothetical protein
VRDLLLSPDHTVHVDGVLIPARLLRNGATIVREDRLPAVRYFHVELDRHAVLLAEGLPAESYLDTGNRGVFENACVPLVLHPDLTSAGEQGRREALSCAPFAADAERVEPVWRRLAARAVELGFAIAEPVTTTDPALRLLIDGRERWPVARTADRYMFILPESASFARLVWRSTAPCDLTPWIEDHRSLGVAVGRIVLAGSAGSFAIAVDDPLLAGGWWAAERDGQKFWRWTRGTAGVSLPPGFATMEIHLAGANTYLLMPETDAAVAAGQSMVA